MRSTPPRWNGSLRTSTEEHSPIELENRLTTLELSARGHGQEIGKHADRLNLHERCIIGILMALYVLGQDKFPAIGALLRRVLAP